MIENPIKWPSGYRCAVNVSFDMDAESLLHIYFSDTAHNRVAMASRLRYGPEVAVPRIVDAFRRLDLRQTFFIPGWCMEQYPRAVQLIVDHGHEIAHHGYMHEKINQLIEHMKSKGGVWFARLDEIATHVRTEVAAGWTPRVDRLPFWDAPVPGVLVGSGVRPD